MLTKLFRLLTIVDSFGLGKEGTPGHYSSDQVLKARISADQEFTSFIKSRIAKWSSECTITPNTCLSIHLD